MPSSSSRSESSVDAATRACAYGTIQSDRKGQFADIVEHLESKPEQFRRSVERLGMMESDLDRVCLAAELLAHVQPLLNYRKKDAAEAKKKRLEGNQLFKEKNMEEAFQRYNMSVLRARSNDNSEENTLALSLANRSACLFHMGEYEATASDVHSAIADGYPEDQRHKLYLRLAKSYLKLGLSAKARPALLIAKNLLKEHGVTRESEIKETDALLKKCDDIPTTTAASKDPTPAEPRLSGGPHEKLAPFSSKLEVKYSADAGRFVAARADVAVGDTLVVEDPYAAALYPEKFGLNCQTCLARLRSVVPCQECAGVAYCSVACRDAADAAFHRYECSVNETIAGFGCSQVARLAYRMVASRPLQFFLDHKHSLDAASKALDETSDTASDNAYVQVFNLVSNDGRRWGEDDLRRALMAALLLKILKEAGYFPAEATTFEVAFVGSLLLRNLRVLQFNAHEVYETLRTKRDNLSPHKSNAIALAIYPRASYFNHSCHGGVARYFVGARLVLAATRSVAAGAEVHENYGPTFYLKGRAERRRHLGARYWFDCRCAPCTEDWPLLKELSDTKATKLKPWIERAMAVMAEGRAAEAAAVWVKIIATLEKLHRKRGSGISCIPPTEELVRAEDKLRTCISNLGSLAFVPGKPTVDK